MDTNFDSVDVASVYKKGGYDTPLTSNASVTVGTDFDTFAEAMAWAIKMPTIAGATIIINLPAGTHLMPEPSELNTWDWTYFAVSNRLQIKGASMATTIITMPDTDDGDNYPSLFAISTGGFVYLTEVTIDPAAGSYPYPENIDCGWPYAAGRVFLYNVTIQNCASAFSASDLGSVAYTACVIDSQVKGLNIYGSGITTMAGSTISNCTTGITIQSGVNLMSIVSLKNQTFTSNTTDTSVPINEIQYNGGYISDGSAAMTLKA